MNKNFRDKNGMLIVIGDSVIGPDCQPYIVASFLYGGVVLSDGYNKTETFVKLVRESISEYEIIDMKDPIRFLEVISI